MKKKRIAVLLSAVMLMASALMGCQSSTETEQESSVSPQAESSVTQTAAKEKEPVTLRFSWWGGDSRHEATIKAIELYMEKNPDITIEYEYMGFDTYYQKLLTQLSGGTQPDIVSVDYKWIGDLVAQGKPFVNINDIRDQIDLSNFDESFLTDYCGQGDYLIGIPCGINGRGALYNTEFFKQYGLTAGDDWTWDDLLKAGAEVNAQNPDAHLLFLTNDVLVYVTRDIIKQKYGENMISDDYELICTPEDLTECMEMIKKLIETGTMPPLEESVLYETVFADQIPYWLEGKWGMTVYSASNLPAVVAASPFEVDTMRWVVADGAKDSAITISPTMMLAIPEAGEHKEEAAAFINWFMNDEEAIRITGDTRGIPANKQAQQMCQEAGLLSPQVSSILEQALAAGGSPENGPTLNSECATIISDYSHKVGYGEMSPEEAGQKLYDDLTYTLGELKEK